MLIKVTNPLIIRLAWGPRRVTSRTRYGSAKAYPSYVTATHDTWLRWLRAGVWAWLTGRWQIVTPPSKANKRIANPNG